MLLLPPILLVLVLVLVLLLSIATASPSSSAVFVTRAGTSIPTRRLHQHLRQVPRSQWHDYIVDLNTPHDPLRHSTAKVHYHQPSLHAQVSLNGRHVNLAPFRYHVHTHRHLTLRTDTSGLPFSLSEHGRVLHPLSLSHHPGVFVRLPGLLLHDDAIPTSHNPSFSSTSPTVKVPFDISCANVSNARVAHIASAFDNTFCAIYRDDPRMATAAIADAFDQAEEPFRRSSCIRFRIIYFDMHCNDPDDPYRLAVASRDSSQIISTFRMHWIANHANISRTLAYLSTGLRTSNSIGAAYLNGACGRWDFGWTETVATTVLSHELGHSFSARHTATDDTQDLMDAVLHPTLPYRFTNASLQLMTGFVDEVATCLVDAAEDDRRFTLVDDVSQTCVTGFSSKLAPDCVAVRRVSTWDIPTGNNADGTQASVGVDVDVGQFDGGLNVTLHARQGRIGKYRHRMAMEKIGRGYSTMGDWIWSDNRDRMRRTTWWTPLSLVSRPDGMDTCCDRRVWIHIEIRVCARRGAGCVTAFKRVRYRLVCVEVCTSADVGDHVLYGWRVGCPFCSESGPTF